MWDDPYPRSLLLTAFVIGQTAFMFVANGLQWIPRAPLPDRGDYVASFQKEGRAVEIKPIQNGIDALGHMVDRYAEMTGQTQAWKMFSSTLPDRTLSPVVELSGSGSTRRIESPHPVRCLPFRWPSLDAREHHRQFQTVMLLWERTPEHMRSFPDGDYETHRILVNARRSTIEAFLLHTVQQSSRAFPDSGSTDTATLIARFDSKSPSYSGFDERPVCRLNLKTGEWAIYHAGECRMIPEPP
jgi:hypothetical protein